MVLRSIVSENEKNIFSKLFLAPYTILLGFEYAIKQSFFNFVKKGTMID